MKENLPWILALIMAFSTGGIGGRMIGIDAARHQVRVQCDKVGGVALDNKAYTCSRTSKKSP